MIRVDPEFKAMALRAVAINVRHSTGPIDTPWGADLRNIEKRIRDGDRAGIRARWESGRHILKQRVGQQLPKGLLAHLCIALSVSQSELSRRTRFAELCTTESKLSHTVTKFGTWRQIITRLLATSHQRKAVQQMTVAMIRRLATHCHTLAPNTLTTPQREALETLHSELTRLLVHSREEA
jgi:hypothetical protein